MDYQTLFDESLPYTGPKLSLLEQTVTNLYSGNPGLLMQSQEILTSLETQTNLWIQTAQIIDNTQNNYTQFFALNCLNKGIALKWNILSIEQRISIKNYIETLMYTLL